MAYISTTDGQPHDLIDLTNPEVDVSSSGLIVVDASSKPGEAADDVTLGDPLARRGSFSLRRLLIMSDLVTVLVTSLVAVWMMGDEWPLEARKAISVILVDVATIGLLASQRLYQSRVSSIRTVETARLGRVVALAGLFAFVTDRVLDVFSPGREVVARALAAFFGLVITRAMFRSWLRSRRRRGRNRRPVIIVGTSEERQHLRHLVQKHPESGYEVRGYVGPRASTGQEEGDVPWLGELPDIVPALRQSNANGAFIASNGLHRSELNRIVRSLSKARAHIHLASGLRGVAHRRVVSHQLAEEPLLYLEHVSLTGWQMCLKRTLDLVLGTIGLVLALPVLVIAGLAIKVYDGGPVLFRQQRVGRNGKLFTILKLRTMQTDAEQRLSEVMALNQRKDGPLFKVANDPRVTPVGRLLRLTSVDELPQLVNVLLGKMSLVGPRPALLNEVKRFNGDLHSRHDVRPGITGLWQVEARDDPSFQAYEQWDTYYVDNWSVGFDLAIIISTVQQFLGRAGRCMIRRRSCQADGPTLVLD
jgi:exopolysaccharide biosynthesis polyprenyl glycosylphosphotransferase